MAALSGCTKESPSSPTSDESAKTQTVSCGTQQDAEKRDAPLRTDGVGRGKSAPAEEASWFVSTNELPETEIIDGPAPVTGPMVGIEWVGYDLDGVIAAYDYRLFRWELGEWIQVVPDPAVAPSVTVGPEVTSVFFGPLAGQHKFEVWATDNDGGADPTPAEVVFTCNPELAGPVLTIETNVLGTHEYRGPVWPDAHNRLTGVLIEHLVFNWSASADDYGGEVVGYRHAWDDTSSWPEWSLDDTSFEVTPEPGEHSLYVHALDNANVITRARIYIGAVEADLSQYILVVDDYNNWELNPEWGTDADRDAFYDTLLCDCDRPRVEWSPSPPFNEPPDVETLASASTVVWYCDGTPDAMLEEFGEYVQGYRPLAAYVRVGGNLVLSGFEVLRSITGEYYPIMLTAQDESPGAVFVRDQLRIGYAQSSGSNANKDYPWAYGYCFYGAVPGGTGIPLERTVDLAAVFVDTLGKWSHMYNHPMDNYWHSGLPTVEKLEAYGPGIEAHEIDAFLNYNFEGRTCVVVSPTGTNRGNVCYFAFGLYYLKTYQVKALFDELMAMFGEMAEVPN
jgi:hypothetical protein